MRLQAGGVFLAGRPPEDVEPTVVPHYARPQRRLDARAVRRIARQAIVARFDRWPRRDPQWTHTARFVKNFCDVAATLEDRQTQLGIFDGDRTASVEQR